MTNLDFSTCSEEDANNKITVSSTTVSWADIQRDTTDANHYVYKDFGAGYFGNHTFQFEFQMNYAENSSEHVIFSIANALGDMEGVNDSGDEYVRLYFYRSGDGDWITYIMGESDNESDTISEDTSYYATLVRSGATVQLTLYDDSERTIETWDEPLGAAISDVNYRYLYACQSRGRDPTYNEETDGFIAHLSYTGGTNHAESLSDNLRFSEWNDEFRNGITIVPETGTTIILESPISITWQEGRMMKQFSFWDDSNVAFDIGKDTEKFSINTYIKTNVQDVIEWLDSIVEEDTEVTLSGFDNSMLDTTWLISGYTYNVEAPIVDYADVNINFEKVP